jgi:arylamine N-acetyltransferase
LSNSRSRLPAGLVERVLERLGLSSAPPPDRAGLGAVYGAWCRKVPFDNVRKLIHLRSAQSGVLPGDTPEDFFDAWLLHGTGGTCWAGNGALQALLRSLGFDALRVVATMVVAPDLPPNHGSVMVRCEAARYLVDASILHGEPLALEESAPTLIAHGAWGVRCARLARRWMIGWRPLHATQGIDCRIERLAASAQEFHERHEQSRPWSPFNYALYARVNRGDTVLGTAFGQRVTLLADGEVRQGALDPAQRAEFLLEQIGLSESIVALLPPDLPMPPPPKSQAASGAAAR